MISALSGSARAYTPTGFFEGFVARLTPMQNTSRAQDVLDRLKDCKYAFACLPLKYGADMTRIPVCVVYTDKELISNSTPKAASHAYDCDLSFVFLDGASRPSSARKEGRIVTTFALGGPAHRNACSLNQRAQSSAVWTCADGPAEG